MDKDLAGASPVQRPVRPHKQENVMIVTERVDPPVPTRQYDWVAYVGGGDENTTGRGQTEAEALRDLCDQLAEQDANRAAMRAQAHEEAQCAEWHAEMRRDAFGV